MNSNFEYYKVFYYVAKYENLTKASSVLKTSQPAVTRTIHNLENELGCRLFTRSKSGMKLTPEGRTFYSYVSAGCAQFFKGENDLSNLISLENGTIYISATETALHCFLFRAMGEFNSIYPNVHFKILNNSTMDSVNAVKEGKVDLAFVSTDLQVNKPLRMKKLREYHEVLIGGSRYIELKGRKISLEELSTYPWISLTSEALTRKFLNNYFADHGLQFLPDMELATTRRYISVALFLKSPSAGVTRYPCPVEPGLSSQTGLSPRPRGCPACLPSYDTGKKPFCQIKFRLSGEK